MESLFDENFRYTTPANYISARTSVVCQRIMDEWVGYGYSPREIAYIMRWAISDLELDKLIDIPK